MNYDEKCQLLIIGDSTVGKTSLLSRFTNGTFNVNYLATVGLDFFTKDEIFDNKTIRIKIWDTAGQERYKSLTQGFFRNAQGILVVYDVTNAETFENLKYWIQSIKTHVEEEAEGEEIPLIILGNKIDLENRDVQKADAQKFCDENKCKYFETSAKTGEGVEESIRFLVDLVLKKIAKGNTPQRNTIKIEEYDKMIGPPNKKCCLFK